MRALLHQATKDIRAQKWLLVAWVAALGVDCLVYSFKLDAYGGPAGVWPHTWLDMLRVFSVLGAGAYAWLLAIRIVHADPADDTTAFWLTRPMPARVLVAAKLALIAVLFLVLPGAATLVIAVSNGVGFLLALRSAVEWAAVDAALLLPVLVVATLTHDIARAAVAGTASILVRAAARGAGSLVWTWRQASSPRGIEVWCSTLAAAVTLTILLAVALMVLQYVTRRSKRTFWLAAAAVPVVVLVLFLWPWNVMPQLRPGAVDPHAFDAGRIGVSLDFTAAQSQYVARQAGPGRQARVYAGLDLTGVPDGWVVVPLRGRGDLRFADSATRTTSRWDLSAPAQLDWPRLDLYWNYGDAVASALHATVVNRPVRPVPKYCVFQMPEDEFLQRLRQSAQYEADLTCAAFAIRVAAVLPLRPGGTAAVDGTQIAVVGVRRTDRGEWRVLVRWSSPRFVLPRREPEVTLFLVNRGRRQAVRLWSFGAGLPGIGPASSQLDVQTYSVQVWPAVKHDTRFFDNLLDSVELAVVQVEDKGRFVKHVSAPDFVVAPLADREFEHHW